MKKALLFFLTLTVNILSSCEHRILTDPDMGHYIRIYLDENIPNVTTGFYNPELERPEYKSPEIFRVVLASPQTGKIITQRHISNKGQDERGKYIDGYIAAPAGVYNFMAYNIGSSLTLLRDDDNYYNTQAYTTPVSERMLQYIPSTRTDIPEDNIRNQPDHIFHQVCEHMNIRFNTDSDTLRTETSDYFTAHSIVKSYYIQINIKGLEYVRSAASVLSGMAGSSMVCYHNGLIESDPVHVFFGMNYTGRRRSSDNEATCATLYSTFNTFGKIKDIPSIYTVNLEFNLSDGTTQTEVIDITDMFDTPMVIEKQWIIIDKEIEIIPPQGAQGGGGMRPGVEGWEDIEADISM